MIFVEKRGRFGNFLFQYFLAKYIQKFNKKKIIIFSENENIYNFNSKKNIDSLVNKYFSLPKYTSFLNLWKKKCIYLNDGNYKDKLINIDFLKDNFYYIDGFFQDIDFINDNLEILRDILDKKKILPIKNFTNSDLTIHIRHLHHELGTLDANPEYQEQPNIELYKNVIDQLKAKKIKVVCSNKNNNTYKNLKDIYKNQIFLETGNDINDFFQIINSENIVLSNSTYSLWGSFFSNAKNVYVPNIGVLKKILKGKNLNLKNNYIYL